MAENVINLLNELKKYFKERNIQGLRSVTNKSASNLAIEGEKTYLYLALLSYTLAKLLEKPRYAAIAEKFFSREEANIARALQLAKENKRKELEAVFEASLKAVATFEQLQPRFISNLIETGRTKIGAYIYAQGFSLNSAVALTGARRNEILSYSGKTMMADRFGKTLSAAERLKHARKILK